MVLSDRPSLSGAVEADRSSDPLWQVFYYKGRSKWRFVATSAVTRLFTVAEARGAHGMVTLELDGRYPPGSDLERTWSAGSPAFERAAHRLN
jgi:hypothetical protein